jgi:hypothetical protein
MSEPIRIVRHHMTNKCRGGLDVDNNRLRMKEFKEKLLHKHFQNLSWEEIGDVLEQIFGSRRPKDCVKLIRRVSRAKGRAA